MSDRTSLYGDENHTDPWEAAQQRPEGGTSDTAQDARDDMLHTSGEAMDSAQQKGEEVRQKAGEVAGMAQQRADEGMHRAAQTMDQAAERLRQHGGAQGGTVGQVATTAADTLDSASTYLRDANSGELMDQLEAYIRKNPMQSLLVAAGVGFVLSKAFK